MPQMKMLRNHTDLWQMLTTERYTVKDIAFPVDSIAQVTFVEQDDFVVGGINVNVVIAVFVTTYARLKLYQSILHLNKNVLYMDTGKLSLLL